MTTRPETRVDYAGHTWHRDPAGGWRNPITGNHTRRPKWTAHDAYTRPDPCDTCTIRDQHCCDPWENHFDHEGDDR